jgi:hypothetical protein
MNLISPLIELVLHEKPKIFNEIKVRGLWRPF